MIFQAVGTVLGDLFEGVAEFLVGKRVALGKQLAKIAEHLLDGPDVAFVAIDQQFIAACSDVHVEQRFEIFNVLVLNAEQRV